MIWILSGLCYVCKLPKAKAIIWLNFAKNLKNTLNIDKFVDMKNERIKEAEKI